MTICFPLRKGAILLGMKKRGFGAGRWNGFGGKVELDETIENAVQRELREECSLEATGIHKHGELVFEFRDGTETIRAHIFSTKNWSGKPIETAEMRPEWFSFERVPYDTMWPEDRYWLPLLIAGKAFKGRTVFKDTETLLSHDIREIENKW